jgi:hypothetical protein
MVVADPVQDGVFMADEFFDLFSAGIVVFRSSASTLLSFAACPNGTHSAAQVATCWPTQAVDGGFCPDADVVLKASNNNGPTWSALTYLGCGAEHQFGSTIKTDRSRNIVNIALYSSATDPTFQRRVRVILYHINPGGSTPDSSDSHVITTLLNDPVDALGPSVVAARGTGVDGQSRPYVHFSYNNIQGVSNGVQVPDPNNHLSRLDY